MSASNPVRIALVTGGGSGIGRAVAHALVRDGWTVVVAGRRAEALAETVDSAPDPGRARAVTADVTRPDSVAELFRTIAERFGRLDLLVNNAGTHGAWEPVDRVDPADWDATIATNLTGAFLCAREAFRVMSAQRPQGGRIINNGSLSAQVPRPLSVAYTAAKHGVTGLTKALALEGRRFDIACGQIDVGNAASDMTGSFGAGVVQPDLSVQPEPVIAPSLVADTVAHMAGLPLSANVQSVTVLATKMPFVGRG